MLMVELLGAYSLDETLATAEAPRGGLLARCTSGTHLAELVDGSLCIGHLIIAIGIELEQTILLTVPDLLLLELRVRTPLFIRRRTASLVPRSSDHHHLLLRLMDLLLRRDANRRIRLTRHEHLMLWLTVPMVVHLQEDPLPFPFLNRPVLLMHEVLLADTLRCVQLPMTKDLALTADLDLASGGLRSRATP